MTLQDFKLKMISELSSIYEMDELNSVFNLLSEDYLKIPRSKILLANEIDLNESNKNLFLNALERLKTHEPIQYVLGKTNFMDLEFRVNNSVLIPRPETEELVRLMLKEDLDGKEILDIGTGSGCIAISLAKNLSNAKVSALDISKDALEVAKENAILHNVSVEFINADIFEYKSDKKYDVIVMNPPFGAFTKGFGPSARATEFAGRFRRADLGEAISVVIFFFICASFLAPHARAVRHARQGLCPSPKWGPYLRRSASLWRPAVFLHPYHCGVAR